MRRLTLTSSFLLLASLCLNSLIGNSIHGADYTIRQAVYRGNQGHFVGKAEIPEGESAAFAISLSGRPLKAAQDKRDELLRTLRFTHPTKVVITEVDGKATKDSTVTLTCTTEAPAAENDPQTPPSTEPRDSASRGQSPKTTATSEKTVTVEVRYSIAIVDVDRIIYDLELESDPNLGPTTDANGTDAKKTNAKITGHVIVDDRSQSTMNWEAATFRFRNEFADVVVTQVDLLSGHQRNRALKGLKNWPVRVKMDVGYQRMKFERDLSGQEKASVHNIFTLSLPTRDVVQTTLESTDDKTMETSDGTEEPQSVVIKPSGLPPGQLEIHDPAFRLSTTLQRGIPFGESEDVLAEAVKGVHASINENTNSFFQAIRLAGDQIVTERWASIFDVTIRNESPSRINFAFRNQEPFTLGSQAERGFKVANRKEGVNPTDGTISLFEIDDDDDPQGQNKLTSRLEELKSLGRFDTPRLAVLVPGVIEIYKKIGDARREKTQLEESHKVAKSLYDQLTRIGLARTQRRAAELSVAALGNRLKEVTPKETALKSDLAKLIFLSTLPAPNTDQMATLRLRSP